MPPMTVAGVEMGAERRCSPRWKDGLSVGRTRRPAFKLPSGSASMYKNTNAMPKHAGGTVLHLGVRAGDGESGGVCERMERGRNLTECCGALQWPIACCPWGV